MDCRTFSDAKYTVTGIKYQNDVLGARGVGIERLLMDRADYYADIKDCPRIHSLTEVSKFVG